MGAVRSQTPRSMPTQKRVDEITAGMSKAFHVFGCRAEKTADNRKPDFGRHGSFRPPTGGSGSLTKLKNKKVMIFTHGYAVITEDGLKSARDLFSKMQASLVSDGESLKNWEFVLFTWPGDTGLIYFNRAQEYSHISGVALFKFFLAVNKAKAGSQLLLTHSLGAHVGLRALSILGERRFHDKVDFRIDQALLMAAAVENDVFERPSFLEEYHFIDAPFGMKSLHMAISRADDILNGAFRVSERDAALGYSGPESNSPLVSSTRRIESVIGESFRFETHDFSPNSATIMNPNLHVTGHSHYWDHVHQTDYYATILDINLP
jgi:esterase/lipase superfamily enzyme